MHNIHIDHLSIHAVQIRRYKLISIYLSVLYLYCPFTRRLLFVFHVLL